MTPRKFHYALEIGLAMGHKPRVAHGHCAHIRVMPTFDEEAARGVSDAEVRRRWPRFDGVCPDCHGRWIIYASAMHFVMGDW